MFSKLCSYSQTVFVLNVIMWSNPTYVDYQFPTYIHIIGWLIALTPLLSPPVYGLYLYLVTPTPGTWKDVSNFGNKNNFF